MSSSEHADDRRRQQALRQLHMRTAFLYHAVAYVLVNGLLVGVWVVTDAALFWPIFPLLGWGIGLAFHAVPTFRRPPSEERIQREMERLGR